MSSRFATNNYRANVILRSWQGAVQSRRLNKLSTLNQALRDEETSLQATYAKQKEENDAMLLAQSELNDRVLLLRNQRTDAHTKLDDLDAQLKNAAGISNHILS
jgi:predicted nuclease with TOPRIM domain